jgi:hypothetical protein
MGPESSQPSRILISDSRCAVMGTSISSGIAQPIRDGNGQVGVRSKAFWHGNVMEVRIWCQTMRHRTHSGKDEPKQRIE